MGQFFKDVLEGRVRDVKKWVEDKDRVCLYDQYGNTALHLAAEKGFRGVCKVLLDAGADVNQQNQSVGWTAVHYAAYEGHSDVLRMLLAHGAQADLPDKAGDTAATYAQEWDNTECLHVLQEAMGVAKTKREAAAAAAHKSASRSDSLDSEESEQENDSEDEEDEDESSMMNWVCPMVCQPNNNMVTQGLVAGNRSQGLQNLSILPIVKEQKLVVQSVKIEVSEQKVERVSKVPSEDSLHMSIHLAPPPGSSKKFKDGDEAVGNVKKILGDDSIFKQEIKTDADDDTDDEDTLGLIKETESVIATRESSPGGRHKHRPVSIVDRLLKDSISPSPVRKYVNDEGQPDVDKLLERSLMEERQKTREGGKSCRERSVARALSQAKEMIARERSQNRQEIENTAVGGLVSDMSSATIPDDMTMSCVSIVDRFTGEQDSEKELLLKRLKEVLEGESKEINGELKKRKKELEDMENVKRSKTEQLKREHKREEEEMKERHTKEREALLSKHQKEEERVIGEIHKLEQELETIMAPSQMLASLTSLSQEKSSSAASIPAKPGIGELEQELKCCGCNKVCAPPSKIYQCPEGDLLCQYCRSPESGLTACPCCGLELEGQTSRNKVLEKIARKYFQGS